MAKASINFAKASSGGLRHNDRSEEKEPGYLLPVEHRLKNEVDVSAKEAESKIKDLYSQAKENYQKTFKQPLKAKSYLWEAVVNLNKDHTLEDVQRLTKEIEKETGFTSVQIAIHRDEGHINERGIPQYNLHAHITFFTLDKKSGQQLYRRGLTQRQKRETPDLKVMNKTRLSKLQDLTAKTLKMERGKKGSNAQRLNHKQYKAVKQAELAKVKNLTMEIKELRAELKAQGAVREDYAKLEAENKELKTQVKNKELTIEELKDKIELIRKDLSKNNTKDEKIKQYRELLLDQEERIDTLIDENKALQSKISLNEGQSTPQIEKTALKGNFEEIYSNLKDHSRDFGNVQIEEMFLKSSIKRTLERDTDKLVDKHTIQREIKTKLGLVSEFVDVVDKKALKEEIKELQKEHKNNYNKFYKLLNLFAKPAQVVMAKIQEVQSKIFIKKTRERKQSSKQYRGR